MGDYLRFKQIGTTHKGYGEQSFEGRLYRLIEKADMNHRSRLWLAFPQQVNEVMEYEGHKPFDHSTQVSIEELCGIHNWEVDPADIEYMLADPCSFDEPMADEEANLHALLEELSAYNQPDMLDGYLNPVAEQFNERLTQMGLPTIDVVHDGPRITLAEDDDEQEPCIFCGGRSFGLSSETICAKCNGE